MALIVSVSGVRGLVDIELTDDVVYRFAFAFGSHLGAGQVVALGRDSRPSGTEFRQAAIAGLIKAGCQVRDLGIVPTPTIGFLVRELQCAGGLQITASHNPAPYNGLKLFGPDGAVLTAAAGATIKQNFEKTFDRYVPTRQSAIQDGTAEADRHLRRVLQSINAEAIARKRYKVVLDANAGAGGPLAYEFLNRLNCQVTPIGVVPDGQFLHEPEPTPEHLRTVEIQVRHTPEAIGCCLDPDADRLVMIDESGQCLSEELTLALAIQSRLRKERGPVVINLSTSKATEDVVVQAGVSCLRSAVGEANVVAKMREVHALIGGEGNGGVIDPRIGWVRDPFIGMGLIMELMAESGKSLQQLARELPQYNIAKAKLSLPPSELSDAFQKLAERWPDAVCDRTDGLRLSWPSQWIHLRSSNTEPIVRLIAESPTREETARLLQTTIQLMQPV
jgi:phosphomannomutase